MPVSGTPSCGLERRDTREESAGLGHSRRLRPLPRPPQNPQPALEHRCNSLGLPTNLWVKTQASPQVGGLSWRRPEDRRRHKAGRGYPLNDPFARLSSKGGSLEGAQARWSPAPAEAWRHFPGPLSGDQVTVAATRPVKWIPPKPVIRRPPQKAPAVAPAVTPAMAWPAPH
jgi:hypothetical protein